MTEKEVLEILDFFKQAIQKLKEERDYWKEQAEENPQEVCERGQIEQVRNDFANADLERDRLKAELERADLAYAKLAHMYNEKNTDSDKKYTEEDLKKLLHKASKKSKEKIDTLTKQNQIWEEEYDKLKVLYDNLEVTSRGLEREIQEKHAEEDIDKILDGKLVESEIDEILTKPTKVVKLDV